MNIQVHPDAELSLSQLQELANRLMDNRREFADRVNLLKPQIAAKDDCSITDAADAASLQETRMRASSIADQNKQTIAEIDNALERIANGRYGVSEATGEPIPYERLLLVPWARTNAVE